MLRSLYRAVALKPRPPPSVASLAQSRGVSSAMTEAKSGDPMHVVASAILGGLLGGAAGCSAGAAIGAPIDQVLPDSFRCHACGNFFDANRADPALT
ncbi:hypothetical protein [Rhodanobacter sp. T12-5]|uniref:hypothetical protein n=1 Tax=Rhodanobacter sp. T12-5 TaxID=2024611 RepID=UPI0011EF2E0A|nr:hypothetical protein [Rhodanobacter sp. T12-5]KAA0068489.1 hypothetical protein CIW53_16455 [Rhodanobacter sp. T12-5]